MLLVKELVLTGCDKVFENESFRGFAFGKPGVDKFSNFFTPESSGSSSFTWLGRRELDFFLIIFNSSFGSEPDDNF